MTEAAAESGNTFAGAARQTRPGRFYWRERHHHLIIHHASRRQATDRDLPAPAWTGSCFFPPFPVSRPSGAEERATERARAPDELAAAADPGRHDTHRKSTGESQEGFPSRWQDRGGQGGLSPSDRGTRALEVLSSRRRPPASAAPATASGSTTAPLVPPDAPIIASRGVCVCQVSLARSRRRRVGAANCAHGPVQSGSR